MTEILILNGHQGPTSDRFNAHFQSFDKNETGEIDEENLFDFVKDYI